MKLLLDTHTWLWYLLGDERLPSAHRALITAAENQLYLSPISVWEAHLLIERKRIAVEEAASQWIHKSMQVLPLREAVLSFEVAQKARNLSLAHQDPADRFIAATASALKMPLLTSDARLRACPDIQCL